MIKHFLVLLFPFLLGANEPPCPLDMVLVNEFCIDRYEWPNEKGKKPLLGYTAIPTQRDGGRWDAMTQCDKVGKRMCVYDEWVSACLGPNGAKYPWGNKNPHTIRFKDKKPYPCNVGKRHKKLNEYKIYLRDPKEMKKLDQSEPAGYRETCKSAAGVYDMTGNAEEWIICSQTKKKTTYCLAAGHWSRVKPCASVIRGHSPKWHYYETGFRCCKDKK